MNLVAKEYVASRCDEGGALVLSEFTGASNELTQAYLINPHDIEGLKDAIVRAVKDNPREKARQMRAMRRRVFLHDVGRWASDFLRALGRTDSAEVVIAELAVVEAVEVVEAVDGQGPGGTGNTDGTGGGAGPMTIVVSGPSVTLRH
jgi:trehalose-6-phosphate synthase